MLQFPIKISCFLFLLTSISALAIPNPAAVNCTKHNLTYIILKDPQANQVGICIFKDAKQGDSYCDEWSYFRHQCKKGQNKWPGKTANLKNLTDYCVKQGKISYQVIHCNLK